MSDEELKQLIEKEAHKMVAELQEAIKACNSGKSNSAQMSVAVFYLISEIATIKVELAKLKLLTI